MHVFLQAKPISVNKESRDLRNLSTRPSVQVGSTMENVVVGEILKRLKMEEDLHVIHSVVWKEGQTYWTDNFFHRLPASTTRSSSIQKLSGSSRSAISNPSWLQRLPLAY